MKYRNIEISRINGWTHMNRFHRASHDLGQNEAKRSNAAIGEALVDGRASKWEYYRPTDIMGEKKLRNSLLMRSRSLRQKQWSEMHGEFQRKSCQELMVTQVQQGTV